jgi:hypothetical protein
LDHLKFGSLFFGFSLQVQTLKILVGRVVRAVTKRSATTRLRLRILCLLGIVWDLPWK